MQNDKNMELAELMFPDIKETVEDLEKKYPKRNIKEGAYVIRFAPSPTGFLHTGALFTSLINKRLAEQTNGIFYLRIEDTDKKREVEGSIKGFTSEMKEFGIIPDEGVISDTEEIGDYGPYTQSKREEIYKICAKYLVQQGLAYPCFCTPECLKLVHETQEKNKMRPGYYSTYARCRNLSIDESIEKVKSKQDYIVRFKSNGNHLKKVTFIDKIRGKIEIAQNDQDIVIIKSDGLPTYHFAHVVDDHFMRTSFITRGEEWIPSTPVHIELFEAMGFEVPEYAHFPSVMIQDNNSKRKLSKRKDKEAAVSYFLEAGYPVDSILEYLLTIINSDYEQWRKSNLDKSKFDFKIRFEKMSSAGAIFDKAKLDDVSKEVIARMSSKEVLDYIINWSKKYDEKLYELINKDIEYSKQVFALERENTKKIRKDIIKWEDIKPNFFYFFNILFEEDTNCLGYNVNLDKNLIKEILQTYINVYDFNDDKETWFNKMKDCAINLNFCTNMKEYKNNPTNYKGSIADFAGVIRLALTNRSNTPDIYAIMQILGESEVINRFNKCIKSM